MIEYIKHKNYIFKKYISNEEIIAKSIELAKEINHMYKNDSVVFIGVLNGCFPFMSTLLKYIEIPYNYEFIKVSSYKGTESKELKMYLDINKDYIIDKNIIIIEDIVDSGKTVKFINNYLNRMSPRDFKVVSLLTKVNISKIIDWYGFIIDDKFVIGFGMDIDGEYRNLKDIYINNEKET